MLNGEKHGKGKIYDIDNNIEIESVFFNGKESGISKAYKNGILLKEIDYSKPYPEGKEYNDQGKLIFEGTFDDRHRSTGNYKEYYENGNIKLEGKLNNECIEGTVKEYYNDGKLLFEGEYELSERYNGKIYDKNGKIIDEIKEFQSLKEKEEENKKIKFEGEYLEGNSWNGKYKEYYDVDNHILKFEGEYINGKLNGIGKEYNEKG